MIEEFKLGIPIYKPSDAVLSYLERKPAQEIANQLPLLQLQKARLDSYQGEIGEEVVCTFEGETVNGGEEPTLEQRQYIMARYLAGCQGMDCYCNTQHLAEDLLNNQKKGSQNQKERRKSLTDEQMLDIAEMCFVRMAEIMTKAGLTVRDTFSKYAVPEVLPESKTVLEMMLPSSFFEAVKHELKIKELSDLEIACMMRVLSKPELGNAIILNEFALIMENFGVPLSQETISEEEDYTCEGDEKPRTYDLAKIDEAGRDILEQVARYLLREYQHPREFFGKMVKQNVEIQNAPEGGKAFKLDILQVKDFYLKIKIANIRKNLQENESLNKELCLDPKQHPTLFNMKTFVRALEDVAEIEQEKIFQQEKAVQEQQ